MNNLLMVYITTNVKEQAAYIAQYLLEKKLIACANIFPINSYFEWEQKTQSSEEFVLLCKSMPAYQEHIEQEVKNIHTYETPCIISWFVQANAAFCKWVDDETKEQK